METDNLANPWPNVQIPLGSMQSKETVASVNAFLLKMACEIAQDNITHVKNGDRRDLTFEAQLGIIKKIAKFFNPSWK